MMTLVEPATSLGSVYREQYGSLVRLASILIDDVATCEEIVQDAFVSVFSRPRPLDDDSKLPAYLRSAVLNGGRSHLRRRITRERVRPLRPVMDAFPSAETTAVLDDDTDAIVLALRSLPERQRDVLVLRFYVDLSEREIAETLGISAGTVKTHTSRGLAALAELLEDRR
jgi:RNA polymerase sigma-70 factor (sigma-E family)